MGFLSKITRAVSKATKPAQRLVKAVSKTATKPALKAVKKVRGTVAPAVNKPLNAVAGAMQQAEQNKTAVQAAIEDGSAAPTNPLNAMADPTAAQVAEADRKRKLGVLRRTILG